MCHPTTSFLYSTGTSLSPLHFWYIYLTFVQFCKEFFFHCIVGNPQNFYGMERREHLFQDFVPFKEPLSSLFQFSCLFFFLLLYSKLKSAGNSFQVFQMPAFSTPGVHRRQCGIRSEELAGHWWHIPVKGGREEEEGGKQKAAHWHLERNRTVPGYNKSVHESWVNSRKEGREGGQGKGRKRKRTWKDMTELCAALFMCFLVFSPTLKYVWGMR